MFDRRFVRFALAAGSAVLLTLVGFVVPDAAKAGNPVPECLVVTADLHPIPSVHVAPRLERCTLLLPH